MTATPSQAGSEAFIRAISLYREQRLGEARDALLAVVAEEPGNADAWSALGHLERDIGDAAAAAHAFDRALGARPGDRTALNGRARMALERAEDDLMERYTNALAASPGDPRLILELTEARLGLGDARALDDFAAVAVQVPQWSEGQVALARMRWESQRDEHFADPIRRLLEERPNRVDLWFDLIDLLSNTDHFAAAAETARDARRVLGNRPDLMLKEAVAAGRAGDVTRAGALFAVMPVGVPGALTELALHKIRSNQIEQARDTIDAALAREPHSIPAWGVAEFIYRKSGDPRSAWLSGDHAFVRTADLELSKDRLEQIRQLLLNLHRSGVQAAGQTVRDGTQTRWRLFDRLEPELAELKQALTAAIADYVAGLPPADERHPLLRHRDAPLTITGSWSVRLTGSGHHVSHIHPLGLISSACYLVVPKSGGELELGRPPPDLNLDLEPLKVVAPRPGQLTLFPSFLHHGTRPFSAGERLTVAFDVARRPIP